MGHFFAQSVTFQSTDSRQRHRGVTLKTLMARARRENFEYRDCRFTEQGVDRSLTTKDLLSDLNSHLCSVLKTAKPENPAEAESSAQLSLPQVCNSPSVSGHTATGTGGTGSRELGSGNGYFWSYLGLSRVESQVIFGLQGQFQTDLATLDGENMEPPHLTTRGLISSEWYLDTNGSTAENPFIPR
jgi:hypothetical protein